MPGDRSGPRLIPITRPCLGEPEARAAAAAVSSGWVAQGPRVREFERAVAAEVGARHAVAVSSGTAALHLALAGAGVGPGDEVIVPALTFVATANAVLHAGARPVFAEVQPHSYNLDPDGVARALTPRTRAVIPVHQLGRVANLERIRAAVADRPVTVVEDAACALGAARGGAPVGSRGPCCFSFHPRKVITTGEGGMITTEDDALADRLRALRSHGATVGAEVVHLARRVTDAPLAGIGYNYRLTDIQAAVGLEQLRRLPDLLARRRALAARYARLLANVDGVQPPHDPGGTVHTFQSYMVLLDDGARRPQIMQHLLDRGVASRAGLTAIHQLATHQHLAGADPLPVSEDLAARGLMLPLYPDMSGADQDRVVDALAAALPR